jgi:hypothetical protein
VLLFAEGCGLIEIYRYLKSMYDEDVVDIAHLMLGQSFKKK